MRLIIILFLTYLSSILISKGQVIPSCDSLSRYNYQYFNSSNLKLNSKYRSIANCYNFKTDGTDPIKISNLFIALYDDPRKELACLIDSAGKKLIDSIALNVAFFNNNAIVLKNNKYGIVNIKGELVMSFVFNKCYPEDLFNPFEEIVLKQYNYDYYFQPIVTYSPLFPKYGLIDCFGNLLVDTIYNEKIKILCNPKEESKNGKLYENILFKNDSSICIVNYETGKIVSKKWQKENYILPIPLVFNTKQYYIYSSNLTNDYGFIDDEANIVLNNEFEHILTINFADAAFSNAKEVKGFCETLLYPELKAINNKKIVNSFETTDGENSSTAIINLPQYIFIKKKNKTGVFNMETLKIEIPYKYESIYKNNKGQLIGYLKTGKEELLILP